MSLKTLEHTLDEGCDYKSYIIPDKDISGQSMQAYAFKKTDPTNKTLIGSAVGATDGTPVELILELSVLPAGDYIIEIWSDFSGPNQDLLYPNENQDLVFHLQDRLLV